MTTAAMVVGLIPLLIASGAGAASRFSIGLVIVSGMSIGTLFTLFVVPAVYTVLAKDHRSEPEEWGGEFRVLVNRNIELHFVRRWNAAMERVTGVARAKLNF